MNNRESAIKRIELLKGHFKATKDFDREMETCSFNFELAASVVRKLRPEEHYKTIEFMDSLVDENFRREKPKEDLRTEVNKLSKQLLDKLYESGTLTPERVINDLDFLNRCTMQIGFYNDAVCTKFAVQMGLYAKSIKNLGSKIHEEALYKAATMQEMGCFCLTELGHGSDASRIETYAKYDPEANEFVLHSPTETSRKFWIGSLGKTASMAVVFAQLITERVNQGVHGFLVQIRDKKTHKPLPGITIGDCGDKICLQGIDNGWIKFKKVRVPKEALLNRFADVMSDGVYFSVLSSKSKRFAFQLGSLSGGRLAIAQVSADSGLVACTQAIRLWAIRTQFKHPITKTETRLLDYKVNQYRILTQFSKLFLYSVGVNKVVEFWNENLPHNLDRKNPNMNFIHMISSVFKAAVSWDANVAINEARQALGGLGYSLYMGFRETLGISDLNRTWEGDNNILFQQGGRLILKNLSNLFLGKSLMKTCEFLTPELPEPELFKDSLSNIRDLLKLLTIRANTLIHETGTRLQMSEDKIGEWDRSLAFHTIPMTYAYFHRFILANYIEW